MGSRCWVDADCCRAFEGDFGRNVALRGNVISDALRASVGLGTLLHAHHAERGAHEVTYA
jgi:hypothetical protein